MCDDKEIYGYCASEFVSVEKVFRKNFHDGWEREGASVAVYYKGQLVVDLRGGWADRASLRRWNDDTRTVLFSATKAVAALAVAMCVDRGYVRYEQRVVEFWPEFGNHGKGETTVDWVMSHRAGLAVIDEPISLEDARDHTHISRIIEDQIPNWTPGSKSGYHALTYGWLVDQIVRRVDPKQRSLTEFIRDEVTLPHKLDFYLGLPAELEHTLSRLSLPNWRYIAREVAYDPRVLIVLGILHGRRRNSLAGRLSRNPSWLVLKRPHCSFNNPEVHRLEQSAALGISRASDLARMFSLMLQPGRLLSSPLLLERFSQPQIGLDQFDCVVGLPVAKGHGFMYERHPRKPGKWLFGHPGYGGTTLMMDPEEELVVAYVSNGLKTGMGEVTGTYRRLRDSILDSVMPRKGK